MSFAVSTLGSPYCWDYSFIKFNISDVAVDQVGMDVHERFGDSRLISGRFLLFGQLDPFYALLCSI